MLKNISLLIFGMLIFSACSKGGDGGFACPSIASYPDGVTITGDAVYEYRTDGNQAINGTPNPIRQAEIQVLNDGGGLIQCARTKDNGSFSFKIPKSSKTNTIRVMSKINNSTSQISVFNDPANHALHFISKTFTPSADQAVGTLTATAASSGPLKGGAFNILDKVYGANEYLISQTADCDSHISACTPVTTIPAISIFWDKGVDPGEYINSGPLSYYMEGRSELYLLGGEDGDVDSSDTDHFDDTIIVHEYGHFIVDVFSEVNSPRGEHDGRRIIDPRLAWGEGFPDFFQGATRNVPLYLDTSGNVDGTALELVRRDLETPDLDVPTTMGEGNFREFSVARFLWDVIDTPNDGGAETTISPFYEIWTILNSASVGFKKSLSFRNIGLFNRLQTSLGFSDWSAARNEENQLNSENDYIRRASTGTTCAAVPITADDISISVPENGTATNSNQFASNDFYKVTHAGGNLTIQLSYTPNPNGDLDLYLYKQDYVYGDSTTYAATPSVTRKSGANDNAAGTETVTANLPAGTYVINIRVYTGIRLGSANYTMKLNGASLCPN